MWSYLLIQKCCSHYTVSSKGKIMNDKLINIGLTKLFFLSSLCLSHFLLHYVFRLVLSSVSDYFAAMFTNDVREARQEEIKMEGVEPNALWALVQYAYTGN